MPEALPHVSMSRSANYVTQSGIWSTQRLGPLTDRRIAKYKANGYYDGIKRDERKKQRQAKRQKKLSALELLLA